MAGRLHRVNKTIIALLGAVGLCAVLTGTAWAEGPATDTVRYPDVWCRTVPLTGMSLSTPSSLSEVYMDPKNHPIISYVLRLSDKRSIVRFYDFFADKVIDEYVSICESIGKCHTPGQADSIDLERLIRDRHSLRIANTIFDFRAAGYKFDAYNELSPGGSRTISYQEIPVLDGGRLRRTISDDSLYPLSSGLQKFDSKGHELFHVMLVSVTDYKRRWHSNTNNPYWEGREQAFIHSGDIFPLVYDLQDGTYLLKGLEWPGLVRFRGALESPCIANSEKLLVVPAPMARNLYEEALIAAKERKEPRPAQYPHEYAVDFADAYVTEKFREMIKARTKD
jgi:hypothetical protein